MREGVLRICLVGGTGLVGSAVSAQAARHDDIDVVTVGRRPSPGARSLVAEPIDWPALIKTAAADVLVCALGTTMKAAGDRAQFRAIDHDLVRFTMEGALAAGIDHVVLVSSVGADADSRAFYLRVKGETEAAVKRLGFRRLDIVRPGTLLGQRRERRAGERWAQRAAPFVDALALHGPLRRYRSIHARDVAKAILALAGEEAGGCFVHEHDALLEAASWLPVANSPLACAREALTCDGASTKADSTR